MSVSLNERITFTSTQQSLKSDRDKDTEKKVVTGGGAIAATTTAAKARAAKSFDVFNSAKEVSKGMKGFTESTKTARKVTQQSKNLLGKVAENAKWATKSILNWSEKFKNMKYIKPLVESRAFRAGAGALGYGFGFVTLASGISDIAKVTTETVDSQLNK